MKTHLIARIDACEYHNSKYARLTVNVLEHKLTLWMEMKLSKSTYGFGSRQFLITVETKTRPDGEQLHFVETIQPWEGKSATKNPEDTKSTEKTGTCPSEGSEQVGHKQPRRFIRATGSARRVK
jgi:hypothetical protein